jgi:TPR repeat protein
MFLTDLIPSAYRRGPSTSHRRRPTLPPWAKEPMFRAAPPYRSDTGRAVVELGRRVNIANMTSEKATMRYRLEVGVAAFAMLLGLTIATIAGPLEDAEVAYKRGDYATALQLWRPLAEQGVAAAQNSLGIMYAEGEGVLRDDRRAVIWFRKAAEQGNVKAQYNLGDGYRRGQGVRQNHAEAFAWYRKAAEQGYAPAQNSLGNMYAEGLSVPQDYIEAVAWYLKAAEQGHAFAQGRLGIMYRYGRGVRQDYTAAIAWLRKAAEQGNAQAQYNLGVMYARGLGLARRDYTQAAVWYRKAAEQGDADAQLSLAAMYDAGSGVPQDYVEAYKWFTIGDSRYPRWYALRRWQAKLVCAYMSTMMTTAQIADAEKLANGWAPTK